MKTTVCLMGEGRIGLALGGLEGVCTATSLEEVPAGTDVVLLEGDSGVSLQRMRTVLGPGPALFRAAASPGGAGSGIVLLCPESGTPAPVIDLVGELLAGIGVVEMVPEELLPAATAVVASSMTSIAVALEGIEEGALEAGLPRSTAQALARQTLLATALLLQTHPGSPADLKDQVASPGGTTIAGLAALEDRAVRAAFIRAIESGTKRRQDMARRG